MPAPFSPVSIPSEAREPTVHDVHDARKARLNTCGDYATGMQGGFKTKQMFSSDELGDDKKSRHEETKSAPLSHGETSENRRRQNSNCTHPESQPVVSCPASSQLRDIIVITEVRVMGKQVNAGL